MVGGKAERGGASKGVAADSDVAHGEAALERRAKRLRHTWRCPIIAEANGAGADDALVSGVEGVEKGQGASQVVRAHLTLRARRADRYSGVAGSLPRSITDGSYATDVPSAKRARAEERSVCSTRSTAAPEVAVRARARDVDVSREAVRPCEKMTTGSSRAAGADDGGDTDDAATCGIRVGA